VNPLLDRMFENESIRLERNFARNLPETDHDRTMMQQAVINVLENAMTDLQSRENKSYEPEVKVSLEAGGPWVRLKISDNGPGMDEKTLNQAFEPLFTTRARGTGLGLAIAGKIIHEHGGEIVMNSEQGHGTMVVIQLPVRR